MTDHLNRQGKADTGQDLKSYPSSGIAIDSECCIEHRRNAQAGKTKEDQGIVVRYLRH